LRRKRKKKCRYNIRNKGHFDCTAEAVGERRKKKNQERDDNFPKEKERKKKEKSSVDGNDGDEIR
jgi:hypothetical protein